MNLKKFLSQMTIGTKAKITYNNEECVLTYDFYQKKSSDYKVVYFSVIDNTLCIEVAPC